MLPFMKTESDKKIVMIDINKIIPNKNQPRKLFDLNSLAELSSSIKEYGILEPLIVRKADNGYELVAGERRLRAAKIAKVESVPAIIKNLNENDSAIIALIENIQRENLSFMEEAESYAYLMNISGLTQEEIAQKVGKNQSTVANKLRLLKLPPSVKKIVTERGLTERHARALLKVQPESAQMELLSIICKNKLNVKETDTLVEYYYTNGSFEQTVPERKKRKKMKNVIVRDIRLFANTINHAINTMKQSGINAEATKKESDEFIEYVIKIKK